MALFIFSLSPRAEAAGAPSVSAARAIVIHSGGEVVFEKNADVPSLIASTTKIMTAIVSIENGSLDEIVAIKPEWCGIEGSSMYLMAGQEYSVRELITGLMLASGNDAALALAGHVAGDEAAFVNLMNRKAAELGMTSTHFINPHGLNAEGHCSTARDMARLMDYCMRNPDFAQIAGMKSSVVGEQTLINHNKLLGRYPGCIGGKTGYTELAGRCLVSCSEREGLRFICVTLAAPDDWNDHQKLYDWAYSAFGLREVTEGLSFDIPVISGSAGSVRAVPEKLELFLHRSAQLELKCEMPYFVFAPVCAGETAGKITVYLDGEKIAETQLLYEESVEPAARAERILERILKLT